MHHVRCGGEVEPGAARLEREHEERHALVLLEAPHQVAAFSYRGAPVQHEPGAPEHRAEKSGERLGGLAELREHEDLFLLGGDDLGDLAQAREFAAVRLGPRGVAQPLRGVVAELLEAHQERKDHPLAPDVPRLLERRGQGKRFEVRPRRWRYRRAFAAFPSLLRSTYRRDEARAELAPVPEERRQRRSHFVRPELQQSVPRAAREGLRQRVCERVGDPGRIARRLDEQAAILPRVLE